MGNERLDEMHILDSLRNLLYNQFSYFVHTQTQNKQEANMATAKLYASPNVDINEAHLGVLEDEAKKSAELAREIGMDGLAALDEHEVKFAKADSWLRKQGLQALTQEEYNIWREWLPTRYKGDNLSSYNYHEGVPLEVRELIAELKEKDIFDALEIRTPEEVGYTDPALFGLIVRKGIKYIFLLARWAESAQELISLDDIRIVLKYRKWCYAPSNDGVNTFLLRVVVGYFGMVFGIGADILLKLGLHGTFTGDMTMLSVVLAVLFAVLGFMFPELRYLNDRVRRKKLLETHPHLAEHLQ